MGAKVRWSIVVLSHNRCEMLARVLESALAQEHASFEVLVVDNASSDGTPDRVRSDFPDVRLIARSDNGGIAGRNHGYREARGEWILSLDDDIELLEPRTLLTLEERFEAQPELGAATLKICEGEDRSYTPTHWWHPAPREAFQDTEFETDHINEAAVAFRAEALERAGAYYESLFWGGEEWDLSLGLIDAGYAIHYVPVATKHLAPRDELHLVADPRHALLVRNRTWIALRRLPFGYALWFTLPRLTLWGMRSVRYGYAGHYAKGMLDLVRRLPTILRERRPLGREAVRRIRALRSLHRPGRPWDW